VPTIAAGGQETVDIALLAAGEPATVELFALVDPG
jgi:hypothetical protein